MTAYNVFVRRSENPFGSNHDARFQWPEVGKETERIPDDRWTDDARSGCGPGYYGYTLDNDRAYRWHGDNWLAFEQVGDGYRNHGDKIAVRQARTLAHGSASYIARFLRSRGLPVPQVLTSAMRTRNVVDALMPDERRTGLAGISYAVALESAYQAIRPDGADRKNFYKQHTGRSYFRNVPEWRELTDDETRKLWSWESHGGEKLCPLDMFNDKLVNDWRDGVYKPLPVAEYATKPKDCAVYRSLDHKVAIMVDGKRAGWLYRLPPSHKLVKGLDSAKLHKRETAETNKARKLEKRKQERASKLLESVDKVVQKVDERIRKLLRSHGITCYERSAGGWGRREWVLMASGDKVLDTWRWRDGKPTLQQQLDAARRFLVKGY